MSWNIDFMTEYQFEEIIRETIVSYGNTLQPYDIEKFNKNIIDPVKMIFDKSIYGNTWDTQIASEVFRQRDKSNNNVIGYFHQRIFRYIKNCNVPDNGQENGWDVIVECPDGYKIDDDNTVHHIYAEVKNKHNTMNKAAKNDTYNKMKTQITEDDDCVCMLVEAISTKHKNEVWKYCGAKNRRIRRVSIDEFFEIVTGERDAFYKICLALPEHIESVLADGKSVITPKDCVVEELIERGKLKNLEGDQAIRIALYELAFSSYNGFKDN